MTRMAYTHVDTGSNPVFDKIEFVHDVMNISSVNCFGFCLNC